MRRVVVAWVIVCTGLGLGSCRSEDADFFGANGGFDNFQDSALLTTESSVRLAPFVAEHNKVREGLGLPALAWSQELADFAGEWVDEMARRGCGKENLEHRPTTGEFANVNFGENLAWIHGNPWSAEGVTKAWADEVNYYNYQENSCLEGEMCGHYTQIVWQTTEYVGCAMRTCEVLANGKVKEFWGCNYYPPGNYIGFRPY